MGNGYGRGRRSNWVGSGAVKGASVAENPGAFRLGDIRQKTFHKRIIVLLLATLKNKTFSKYISIIKL